MKIALIGYGKMGRELERAAQKRGHSVAARIDPTLELGATTEISLRTIGAADVCLEFTHPEAATANIEQVVRLGKPLVVGTTGWYRHLPEVEKWVSQWKTGLVYAPNFSLGVNLFYRVAAGAARLFHRFDEYDVCGAETHHRLKADSPSGTARQLANVVLEHFPRKKRLVVDSLNRPIEPEEFHLVSLRAGSFPGTHSLFFDSAADTLELTHTARSRAGFASGALLAAEWIVGKQGVYTFENVLEDLLGGML
ncbi:MAG: 4-hydroxy-tetrahydrodipicolinate reductase [Acidimicrobiia bacterium]|nr:4-hydroxy-tetrahydrodipicolinate reductase [Acidimicrobiia bacterium]